MTRVYFQIMSDQHLETHPSYASYTFPQTAPNLALLGDIGHVADPQLFTFLEDQLSRYSIVFYLLGNHEPYHMSFQLARKKMREFQAKVDKRKIMPGKFVFLDQTRFDINDEVTILGCTLFSHVPLHQEFAVESRMVDFRDILRWDVDEHNAAHESDLNWLNDQVGRMAVEEPHRQIVIFSHHSPSTDPRSMDPSHEGSEVSSAFVTDLSGEECWRASNVVLWAFGHTHYNHEFQDEGGKVIMTNQKGYFMYPKKTFNAGRVFTVGE